MQLAADLPKRERVPPVRRRPRNHDPIAQNRQPLHVLGEPLTGPPTDSPGGPHARHRHRRPRHRRTSTPADAYTWARSTPRSRSHPPPYAPTTPNTSPTPRLSCEPIEAVVESHVSAHPPQGFVGWCGTVGQRPPRGTRVGGDRDCEQDGRRPDEPLPARDAPLRRADSHFTDAKPSQPYTALRYMDAHG